MTFNEVGGYTAFDLLLGAQKNHLALDKGELHLFSLGRHCLEAACRSLRPLRVHLPFFICNSVTKVFEDLDIPIVRYALTSNLLPEHVDDREGDLLLLVNYLGLSALKSEFDDYLARNAHRRIIIDNTHSMGLVNQFPGQMSFVSPRKFFPVPDGGILYDPCGVIAEDCLPIFQDRSWGRVGWLFRCLDEGGRQASYAEYIAHREAMQLLPYARMSNTTLSLLNHLDLQALLRVRSVNFDRLAKHIPIEPTFASPADHDGHSAIGYPVRVNDAEHAQQQLAAAGVYTVRYWPELLKNVGDFNSIERLLLDRMLVLPITKRLEDEHLERIQSVLA